MKIHDKKLFVYALGVIAFGGIFVFSKMGKGESGIQNYLWYVMLIVFGLIELLHSLSHKMTKDEIIEEEDERNCLLELKTKGSTLLVSQIAILVVSFGVILMSQLSGREELMAMGEGIALAYAISLLIEFFTHIYYTFRY